MMVKENLKHWYKLIFKRKQYDKEMREGLLQLFEEMVGSSDDDDEEYSVDDLLDKISTNGIKCLTNDEKQFLDMSSKM
jgi:hypothetical protein